MKSVVLDKKKLEFNAHMDIKEEKKESTMRIKPKGKGTGWCLTDSWRRYTTRGP